jgi:hypothetical protein
MRKVGQKIREEEEEEEAEEINPLTLLLTCHTHAYVSNAMAIQFVREVFALSMVVFRLF